MELDSGSLLHPCRKKQDSPSPKLLQEDTSNHAPTQARRKHIKQLFEKPSAALLRATSLFRTKLAGVLPVQLLASHVTWPLLHGRSWRAEPPPTSYSNIDLNRTGALSCFASTVTGICQAGFQGFDYQTFHPLCKTFTQLRR